MRLTKAGRLFAYWPSRKTVALALCFLRVSSRISAYLPGPSSKVSATHFTCVQSTSFSLGAAIAGAGAAITATAAIANSEVKCRDITDVSNVKDVARDVPTLAD